MLAPNNGLTTVTKKHVESAIWRCLIVPPSHRCKEKSWLPRRSVSGEHPSMLALRNLTDPKRGTTVKQLGSGENPAVNHVSYSKTLWIWWCVDRHTNHQWSECIPACSISHSFYGDNTWTPHRGPGVCQQLACKVCHGWFRGTILALHGDSACWGPFLQALSNI